MTRGMIYKLIFILLLIGFAVVLILPTVGEKTMNIEYATGITDDQKREIKQTFSSGKYDYTIEEKDGSLLVTGVGNSITDAVSNGAKNMKGVKDVKVSKHWAEKAVLAKKINLGLDLQGGMHLVLQADFKSIEELKRQKAKIQKLADAKKKKLEKKTDKTEEKAVDSEEPVEEKDMTLSDNEKREITQQALELIRNRIDSFGVAEPSIRPRGNEAIEIQLPGVRNPEGVKKALRDTGRLEYRLVDDDFTGKAQAWFQKNYKDKKIPEGKAEQNALLLQIAEEIGLTADKGKILFRYERNNERKKIFPVAPIVLENDIAVDGTDIDSATANRDDQVGQIVVSFRTTPSGAVRFAKVTAKENKGRRLAIVLDNKVRSAPNINDQITTGSGQITGGFSHDEALTLARIIKEGALPVDLKIIEERTVGPSLGQDSIDSGLDAIMIGLLGVIFFMFLYYRVSGFISAIGLVLNMVFMMAILSWLGFTLTLPGIAGFILTVGMAVDANVIIYERIKEEIETGKSVRMSIVYGFDKAFWTIFDANLTTLIAAFILSQYGTGPVKGFAVTLFIGILCSMFVALYVTRFMYEIISLNKNMKKLSIFPVWKRTRTQTQ
ncbi:MAG: protein translocase subunit SecD [bacterium]|nr:protein translocase subunit SecD [bacterium]